LICNLLTVSNLTSLRYSKQQIRLGAYECPSRGVEMKITFFCLCCFCFCFSWLLSALVFAVWVQAPVFLHWFRRFLRLLFPDRLWYRIRQCAQFAWARCFLQILLFFL